MDFRAFDTKECERLRNALRSNAEDGLPIYMDRRNTSFLTKNDEPTDEEVITAIKSVPCHY